MVCDGKFRWICSCWRNVIRWIYSCWRNVKSCFKSCFKPIKNVYEANKAKMKKYRTITLFTMSNLFMVSFDTGTDGLASNDHFRYVQIVQHLCFLAFFICTVFRISSKRQAGSNIFHELIMRALLEYGHHSKEVMLLLNRIHFCIFVNHHIFY